MADNDRENVDDRLALELAAGRTVAEAAQAAGFSERTAYRRLEDPGFRRHISAIRGEMVSRATGRLADVSAKAVETLSALLSAESETVRLGAARSILELGTKLREANELERRITELEGAANGQLCTATEAA